MPIAKLTTRPSPNTSVSETATAASSEPYSQASIRLTASRLPVTAPEAIIDRLRYRRSSSRSSSGARDVTSVGARGADYLARRHREQDLDPVVDSVLRFGELLDLGRERRNV